MANEQNLRPGEYKLSVEEAKKGGIASGKARRQKADLRRVFQMWLENESGVTDKDGNPLTGSELMLKTAVKEMLGGSVQHMIMIRDTAGFKPVDKVMIADVDQDVIEDVERIVAETESE